MTKKTVSVKHGLLTSAISMLLCISMLVGTTFAWFTDSVTSANNVIQSGNLDISLEYWNGTAWVDVQGASEILDKDAKWEPGYTKMVYLKIENLGSLALKYLLGVNIISETPGVNAEGESFKLSDFIYFNTETFASFAALTERADALDLAGEPKLISEGFQKSGALTANSAPVYVAMSVYMPSTVGNVANHNGVNVPSISLGINIAATQASVESDSFGTDYDAYTEFDVITSVDSVADAASKFDKTKDVLVKLPAGNSDVTAITIHGEGTTESNFALVGNNTVFSGNLLLSTHRNLGFDDDAVYTIEGITVDGTLDVQVDGYKNVVVRNVTAKSISIHAMGNTVIENCTIEDSIPATTSGNGIYVTPYTNGYNLTIKDNLIKNSPKNAIQIAGEASGAAMAGGEWIIEGNTFENWCAVNDKPRSAFKVWGDTRFAPSNITSAAELSVDAVALAEYIAANNTFNSNNANQVKFDFYGFTFNSLD